MAPERDDDLCHHVRKKNVQDLKIGSAFHGPLPQPVPAILKYVDQASQEAVTPRSREDRDRKQLPELLPIVSDPRSTRALRDARADVNAGRTRALFRDALPQAQASLIERV